MAIPAPLRQAVSRVVPRILLAAALLPGFGCLITGIGQRSDVDNAYRIEFGHEGDTCTESGPLYLSVDTGEAMACTAYPQFPSGGTTTLPGFTPAQNGEIGDLVKQLAAGGLSEAEQRRIQDRVDEIAATVPESERPYHYTGLWGTGLALLGGAIVVVSLLLFGFVRRPLRSWLLGR